MRLTNAIGSGNGMPSHLITRLRRRRDGPIPSNTNWPHVVVIGGGFGGINVAKGLGGSQVRLTLVDQHNYHLFQPLLYQVATGSLSPADIASPIRSILRRHRNVSVLLARAKDVDIDRRKVRLEDGTVLDYDILVLASGAQTTFFGHPEWSQLAPGLKDIDDALEIRRRVFQAFEQAERAAIDQSAPKVPTFVIVGGGPTGVELAGSIAEIAHSTLPRDFRAFNPHDARIVLVDSGDRVLSEFPPELSRKAERDLKNLGVELQTGARVTRIEPGSVWLGDQPIETETVLWAAGVTATPIGRTLGVPLDHGGRVVVEPDLTIPGHPEVFVIGDLAAAKNGDGDLLPGTAPVAIQAAQSTVLNIHRHLAGKDTLPFVYQDRGMMATIGRGRAVAVIGNRSFDGLVAWWIWAIIHIWSLIEFRSRLMVMIQWAWAYVSRQRSARLITGDVSSQAAIAASRPQPEPVETGTRMNKNAPTERSARNA